MKYTLTIATDDADEIARFLPTTVISRASILTEPDATEPEEPTEPEETDDGPVNESAPDVDKRGVPWDERIHASSKALNKDGTWRYRRNLDEAIRKSVEEELLLSIPPTMQRTAPIPVPTGVADPAPQSTGPTFEQIVAQLSDKLNSGAIAPEAIPGFAAKCGVASVPELRDNPDALAAAARELALL